jgi:hypothetical protein
MGITPELPPGGSATGLRQVRVRLQTSVKPATEIKTAMPESSRGRTEFESASTLSDTGARVSVAADAGGHGFPSVGGWGHPRWAWQAGIPRGLAMGYVPNDLRLASTYRYIGDTIAELIDRVARESAGDDIETALTILTAHLVDVGAARCTEDPA